MKLTINDLKDNHLYEINNIFDLIGIDDFYVNDRGIIMPCSTKNATVDALAVELFAASREKAFTDKLYDEEPDFAIIPSKIDFKNMCNTYEQSNNNKKLSKDANLMFRYHKSDEYFEEPLSHFKIRILKLGDIKGVGDVTISYLERETEKALNLSSAIMIVDEDLKRETPKLMEVREEDFEKGDNNLYKNLFLYFNSRLENEFKEKYSKFIEVEHLVAKNKNYFDNDKIKDEDIRLGSKYYINGR